MDNETCFLVCNVRIMVNFLHFSGVWLTFNIPCKSLLESFVYFFTQEWRDEVYPPWAHGPGYVVSGDIAKAAYKQHKKGRLKVTCVSFFLLIYIKLSFLRKNK